MALSNRDKVGRGFELLSQGLRPFMNDVFTRIAPGLDWSVGVGRVLGRQMDPDDVQTHLVLLTEKYNELFRDRLPFAARTYANELRDFRNEWAHMRSFSADNTYRSLDSGT